MIAWRSDDAEKLRSYLNLPVPLYEVDAVIVGMNWLTTRAPNAITTIQAKLDQLETIQGAIVNLYTDPNYTLVRADVLEWSRESSKADGLQSLKAQLIDEIATTLNLKLSPIYQAYGNSSWGSTPMYRS